MALDENDVREKLRTFIVTELIRDPSYQLGNDEEIITKGLMDSFALAELGVYVEDQYDVYIPDPDLTVAKMNTLDQMVARVLQG
jgi:acyl carrier protein